MYKHPLFFSIMSNFKINRALYTYFSLLENKGITEDAIKNDKYEKGYIILHLKDGTVIKQKINYE